MTFAINTLTAVNACLASMGELPVNDVDEDHPLVPAALAQLNFDTAFVQAEPWWFNVEYPNLIPDPVTQEIRVPSDASSVDNLVQFPRLAVRDGKLVNQDTSSIKFDRPVRVRLHRVVEFDALPLSARAYIQAKAVRKFHADYDGDQSKMARLEANEKEAYAVFNAEHIRNAKANMFNRSGVASVLAQVNPILTSRRYFQR